MNENKFFEAINKQNDKFIDDEIIFEGEVLLKDGNIGLKEIINGTTERGRILREYYKLKDAVKKLDAEIRGKYNSLYEDHINIVDIYDDVGKEKYQEIIDLIKKEIKIRNDKIEEIYRYLDDIGRDLIIQYFQLAPDKATGILRRNLSDISSGDFNFINDLNSDEVVEFLDKLKALKITDSVVDGLKKEKSIADKKQKQFLDKAEKKRILKELQSNIPFVIIQKVADYVGQSKITNKNSLNNLNLEELIELYETVEKVKKIMDSYGIDEYYLSENQETWQDITNELEN